MAQPNLQTVLMVRTSDGAAALPLGAVIETMRPLPADPVAGAPRFVRGRSVIRGTATLVFDLARLIGGVSYRESLHRVVLLSLGDQPAALAARHVLGVRTFPVEELTALPTVAEVMDSAARAELCSYSPELMLVFETSRFATAKQWAELVPSEASR